MTSGMRNCFGVCGLGMVLGLSGCPRPPCGGGGESCNLGEFCLYAVGSCGTGTASGVCSPIPDVCTLDLAPVCGCDGTTYANECGAWSNSVSVQRVGTCEPAPPDDEELFCGGSAAEICPDGEYCRFELGVCESGDQSGVCTSIPEACSEQFDPVCGCDQNTYDNECMAAMAGMSVLSNGACPTGPG